MNHVCKVSYNHLEGLGLKAWGRLIKQLVHIDFLLFTQHVNYAV